MEKVVRLQKNVSDYLEQLVFELFLKDYFSFESSAQNYVQKIYDFIENQLVIFLYKITPDKLKTLGSKYCFYKPNNRTTWYIFFECSEDKFLVTFITYNYSPIVAYL